MRLVREVPALGIREVWTSSIDVFQVSYITPNVAVYDVSNLLLEAAASDNLGSTGSRSTARDMEMLLSLSAAWKFAHLPKIVLLHTAHCGLPAHQATEPPELLQQPRAEYASTSRYVLEQT